MVPREQKKTNCKKNSFSSNANLYNKFVGFLIKKGNKKKAKTTIESCFLKVFYRIKLKKRQSLNFLLISIFKTMNSFIEIRKIKKRKNYNFVPFMIKKDRRLYLTVR